MGILCANRFAIAVRRGALATIKDVARMAGVSVSTVSKYMNGGNVRQPNALRIQQAIDALDFRANPFARGLKAHRNGYVGILLPDMTTPFFGNVITAFEKVMREQGYHTLISCYGSNHGLERENFRFLLRNGVEGLLYMPEDLSAGEYFELTAGTAVPIVQVDRNIQGVDSDCVLIKNADAAYMAVSRLIERGHRRIAAVTGPKYVFTAKERQVGYLRALSDFSIPYDDSLFISDENSFATGYRGLEQLMALSEPPTAIFCTNYNITMGLVTALRERGYRIPDDIDVFGFDCADICTMMNPPLPVIHQPEAHMGRLAARYLLDRLRGYDGAPRVTELSCTILPEPTK